jgi:hypothetical protein
MSSPASEDTNPKKRKVEDVAESKEGGAVKLNEEGERYWDLGNLRRVTLRNWKGKPWVDVREFYGQEPDLKPGKKGSHLMPMSVSF